MTVPYSFANATVSIPLSQLDSNFNTPITLGNTAIQLGNTVTTLNNMTLANVTISSGNVTITNVTVTTANVTTLNAATVIATTANVTTANITTGNVTTANIVTANITTGNVTNMTSGNVAITGGSINGTTLGASTASTANVTTLTTSSTVTINGGTANGVAYLNGSKVLTTGSALTFNGTNLFSTGSITLDTNLGIFFSGLGASTAGVYGRASGTEIAFNANGSEAMRLTSTSLYTASGINVGIGTSSPAVRLQSNISVNGLPVTSGTTQTNGALRLSSTLTTSGVLDFGVNGSNPWIQATDYTDLSQTYNILLNPNGGNVGIGTSSPASKLHINTGGNTTAGGITLQNSGNQQHFWYLSTNTTSTFEIGSSSGQWTWVNSGGTRLTLDSSGNLGLGVTPSAVSGRAFEIGAVGHGLAYRGAADINLTQNAYWLSGSWRYGGTTGVGASAYQQIDGTHRWQIAPSGTAGNAISFTQAMTLDASGDLLLGTTTKVPYSGNPGSTNFTLSGTSNPSTARPSITLKNSDDSARAWWVIDGNGGAFIGTQSNNYFGFQTNNTERARITSAGDVGIGTSSPIARLTVSDSSNPNSGTMTLGNNASFNGTLQYLIGPGELRISQVGSGSLGTTFYTNGSERARITSGGELLVGATSLGAWDTRLTLSSDTGTTKWGVGPYSTATNFVISASASAGVYLAGTTATSWSSVSDERHKDIIEPIANAAEKVCTLRAVIGKYKADETNTRKSFLIAQDVLAVLPEAVDISNPERFGLAYSDMVPLLVAAIQEQQALITDLRARVTALEAK